MSVVRSQVGEVKRSSASRIDFDSARDTISRSENKVQLLELVFIKATNGQKEKEYPSLGKLVKIERVLMKLDTIQVQLFIALPAGLVDISEQRRGKGVQMVEKIASWTGGAGSFPHKMSATRQLQHYFFPSTLHCRLWQA